MSSFRWRLTLAFVLVAVLPLAIAMLLFSQRIQATVRAQAGDRLAAALMGLDSQLRADGQRVGDRLTLLANDAQLKLTGAKLTDGEVKRLEGEAKMLEQSGIKVDTKEGLTLTTKSIF